MKIRSEQLKKIAVAKGVTPEQLAPAVAEAGIPADRAESAVRNWMAGRDQPLCKPRAIAAMAQQLGVASKDIAKFTSKVRAHRGSPTKAKLVVDMIRGKSVESAMNMLTFTTKRAALNVKKALQAAREEAMLNDADVERLMVIESTATEGPRMKRFQPKDRGRAHPIIKKFSHITVSVAERTPGKRRK